MSANRVHFSSIVALILALIASLVAGARSPETNGVPLGTAFTYQGRLTDDAGLPVDDTCDLQFSLWDDPDAGSQVGATLEVAGVAVSKGLFTTPLDFGSVFDGTALWLKIAVRCSGDPGYVDLSPRQALTAAPYAINAHLLDGRHAAAFLQHPSNLVIVAKSGGDFDTISAALDSIGDASDANRYLVKVMPGIYNEQVMMKPYVDIEGAGELTTKITCTGFEVFSGTLVGADNTEVRLLTIENTGGASYAIAVYNNAASPAMTDMTVAAAEGATSLGVYNDQSSPAMTNLAVTVSGVFESYGVFNSTSSSTMTNVTVTVTGEGIYSIGVVNQDSSTKMTNVTATASGLSYTWGVLNFGSSPTMTNVTATASGGTYAGGVANSDSSVTMTNVTATASEGVHSYGVENLRSSVTIQNSAIRASGGTDNYGIHSTLSPDPNTVTVNNSQVTGSTGTIYCDPVDACRAGASLLDGGPVSGSVVCAGVYDESYTFYANTCP